MKRPPFVLGAGIALGLFASCAAGVPRGGPRVAPIPASGPLAGTSQAGAPLVERLLEADRTVAGEALESPAGATSLLVAQIVTFAPGQSTGWHRHGSTTFGYLLDGSLEVEYEGLGRRTLVRGDRLVEARNVAHNGVNLGDEPARILVVSMGSRGTLSVMKADPPSMPAGLASGRASELVELPGEDPRLRVDLRYATADNFTGRVVYPPAPAARALMQRPAADALARAAARASASGYGLLVLDAYRPWSVTRRFWDEYPMHRAYLADPLEGSRHNRGCAVDLTLFELASGREVEMPSGYDDFSARAHPNYAGGTAAERAARDRLRAIMEAEGFTVYENEWWHFDYRGWQDYPVLDVPLDR